MLDRHFDSNYTDDTDDTLVVPSRHDNEDNLVSSKATRYSKIKKNREFQGWLEFLNQSNVLATTVEFLKKPAETFASLWFVKYINAPLGIVTSFFLAMNAIRKAHIKKDGFSGVNAAVVVGTSAAMIVGAVAVTASIAALSAIAPVLIAASIGVKALWDLGTAFVYGIKAICTRDNDLKTIYKYRALSALVDGVVGGLVTAAVVAVYMAAAPLVQTILTGFAIGAAAIGVIAAIVKIVTADKHAKVEDRGLTAAAEMSSSTCCVTSKLRNTNRNRVGELPVYHDDQEPQPLTNSSNQTPPSYGQGRGQDLNSDTGRGRGMGRGMGRGTN